MCNQITGIKEQLHIIQLLIIVLPASEVTPMCVSQFCINISSRSNILCRVFFFFLLLLNVDIAQWLGPERLIQIRWTICVLRALCPVHKLYLSGLKCLAQEPCTECLDGSSELVGRSPARELWAFRSWAGPDVGGS